MILAHLIILLIAIVFKYSHWPFASELFLFSPVFSFVDAMTSLSGKKENKTFRFRSAIAVFGLGLFIQFKMMSWEGSMFVFFAALLLTLPFLIYLFSNSMKSLLKLRGIVFILFLGFSVWIFMMRQSQFYITFTNEDPFDKQHQMPDFFRHKIAFELYKEGNHEGAATLIRLAIEQDRRLLKYRPRFDLEYQETDMYRQNISHLNKDFELIKRNSWKHYVPLTH